jgi:hypothetical protein
MISPRPLLVLSSIAWRLLTIASNRGSNGFDVPRRVFRTFPMTSVCMSKDNSTRSDVTSLSARRRTCKVSTPKICPCVPGAVQVDGHRPPGSCSEEPPRAVGEISYRLIRRPRVCRVAGSHRGRLKLPGKHWNHILREVYENESRFVRDEVMGRS